MQLTSSNFFLIILLYDHAIEYTIIPQRVRQLHRLAIAKGTALEFAGEIGNAAAPAVFIGEVVHHLYKT